MVPSESQAVVLHCQTIVDMGIDTHQEQVVYMRNDCHICRSEGFTANSRVILTYLKNSVIATLNVVDEAVLYIASYSGHPFVIGTKQRFGDRHIEVTLPDISDYSSHTAVIIDDVFSSGQIILQCIGALKKAGIKRIQCVAVHGIFADGVDATLMSAGLESLVTSNTITHSSNVIDIAPLLVDPIRSLRHSKRNESTALFCTCS